MRLKILAATAALLASQSAAQPKAPAKLLVVIAVDQFSANLFDEYRPQFTAGLERLAAGTVFHNGYQSHALTETCPGHSTMLTGDHPSRTAIINNVWIDHTIARSDKSVYCAEDESQPGTSSTLYKVSPRHLLVPTLGELMKSRWQGSRSVAVSGKDRAAVMMSGHNADQRWYWNGKAFVTDLQSVSVPKVVHKFQAALGTSLAQPRPSFEPPAFCKGKANEIAIQGGGKPVGLGQFARAAGDLAAFRASP